jgi:SNF2 family DNA or RNA helicase
MNVARLELQKEFDELLSLPTLKDVTPYTYQIETARKILRQFRGRVLLADEVGLGKTIEAGIVLKEYLLRGMIERVLILVPPSLIGQWKEEMESKFGLSFITTKHLLLQKNPQEFWKHNRIIASLSLAKRPEQSALLVNENFDLVIVDEVPILVST